MPSEAHEPEISSTGAFRPPGIRIRDRVVDEHRAGIVDDTVDEAAAGPDAAVPPRSDRPVPEHSMAERLRIRLRREG